MVLLTLEMGMGYNGGSRGRTPEEIKGEKSKGGGGGEEEMLCSEAGRENDFWFALTGLHS